MLDDEFLPASLADPEQFVAFYHPLDKTSNLTLFLKLAFLRYKSTTSHFSVVDVLLFVQIFSKRGRRDAR
jgi:hypothetical protein